MVDLDPAVEAAFKCPDGKVHVWIYLRDIKKTYRCSLCLMTIEKPRLKELTDIA